MTHETLTVVTAAISKEERTEQGETKRGEEMRAQMTKAQIYADPFITCCMNIFDLAFFTFH